MLRTFVKIIIKQVPTDLWKDRKRVLVIDFCSTYEIEKGWENHTDTCSFTIPKNVKIENDNPLFKESGYYNLILGGSGTKKDGNVDSLGNPVKYAPLIMKGDVVTIIDGYRFFNEVGVDSIVEKVQFNGFVSKVNPDTPIKIECEDAFFLLKRVQVGVSVWNKDFVSLCKYMIEKVNNQFYGNDFYKNDYNIDGQLINLNPYPELKFYEKTDSVTADFSLGYLDIGNMTCSMLLSKIRTQYKLESFFVDNVLHFGFPIYDEESANNENFFFFNDSVIDGKLEASANIFDAESLEYSNKDDVEMSAIVSVQTIKESERKTRSGRYSTVKEKKSILVYWDVESSTFKKIVKDKGEKFPENEGGERREFVYAVSPTEPQPSDEKLFDYGVSQLQKYMYDGLKGSFSTFGFPFVSWGDNINIIDSVYADRNGVYKVKKVKRSGGTGIGIIQQIFLDYKLKSEVKEAKNKIYMI